MTDEPIIGIYELLDAIETNDDVAVGVGRN